MTDAQPYAPGSPRYNPAKREPVALGGILVVAIQLAARKLDLPMDEEAASVIAHGLSLLVVIVIRRYVMPVATVKAAGLSPDAVLERAADPAVVPYREPVG